MCRTAPCTHIFLVFSAHTWAHQSKFPPAPGFSPPRSLWRSLSGWFFFAMLSVCASCNRLGLPLLRRQAMLSFASTDQGCHQVLHQHMVPAWLLLLQPILHLCGNDSTTVCLLLSTTHYPSIDFSPTKNTCTRCFSCYQNVSGGHPVPLHQHSDERTNGRHERTWYASVGNMYFVVLSCGLASMFAIQKSCTSCRFLPFSVPWTPIWAQNGDSYVNLRLNVILMAGETLIDNCET